jgi:hypothetical protein
MTEMNESRFFGDHSKRRVIETVVNRGVPQRPAFNNSGFELGTVWHILQELKPETARFTIEGAGA